MTPQQRIDSLEDRVDLCEHRLREMLSAMRRAMAAIDEHKGSEQSEQLNYAYSILENAVNTAAISGIR